MVHWSEERDSYRLRITRRRLSALWAVFALLPLFLWMTLMEGMVGSKIEPLPYQNLVGWTIVATIVLFCAYRAAANWMPVAWLEVSLRGGLVRWGGVGQPAMEDHVRAEQFQGNNLLGAMGWNIIVITEEGRRLPVLGGWVAPRPRVQKIVERLNQLLGVETPE